MARGGGSLGSPFGAQRTTFTAWVCFESVARYSTLRFSPSSRIFHSCCRVRADLERRRGANLDLPGHCCRRRLWRGVPCRGVRSGQSRSDRGCYRDARSRSMESPSSWGRVGRKTAVIWRLQGLLCCLLLPIRGCDLDPEIEASEQQHRSRTEMEKSRGLDWRVVTPSRWQLVRGQVEAARSWQRRSRVLLPLALAAGEEQNGGGRYLG